MISTKDKIIDIVTDMLINNINYDEISMNKVAEKVGIGKSTIYEYFNSKNDLLALATSNLADNIISNTKSFNIDEYNFKESFIKQIISLFELRNYRNFAFDFFKNNQDYLKDKNDIIKNCLLQVTEVLKDRFLLIFEKGINEGIISKNKLNEETNMIKGIIIGTVISYEESINDIDLANHLYNTILKICN